MWYSWTIACAVLSVIFVLHGCTGGAFGRDGRLVPTLRAHNAMLEISWTIPRESPPVVKIAVALRKDGGTWLCCDSISHSVGACSSGHAAVAPASNILVAVPAGTYEAKVSFRQEGMDWGEYSASSAPFFFDPRKDYRLAHPGTPRLRAHHAMLEISWTKPMWGSPVVSSKFSLRRFGGTWQCCDSSSHSLVACNSRKAVNVEYAGIAVSSILVAVPEGTYEAKVSFMQEGMDWGEWSTSSDFLSFDPRKDCTSCSKSQYVERACSEHDTICRDCTVCSTGQYATRACSATADTQCGDHPQRPTLRAHYAMLEISWTTYPQTERTDVALRKDGSLWQSYDSSSHSLVALGSGHAVEGPASNILVAVPEGTYEAVVRFGQDGLDWGEWSTNSDYFFFDPRESCTSCSESQYMARACSATDTVCRDCTVCSAGQNMTSACTDTADTQCQNLYLTITGQVIGLVSCTFLICRWICRCLRLVIGLVSFTVSVCRWLCGRLCRCLRLVIGLVSSFTVSIGRWLCRCLRLVIGLVSSFTGSICRWLCRCLRRCRWLSGRPTMSMHRPLLTSNDEPGVVGGGFAYDHMPSAPPMALFAQSEDPSESGRTLLDCQPSAPPLADTGSMSGHPQSWAPWGTFAGDRQDNCASVSECVICMAAEANGAILHGDTIHQSTCFACATKLQVAGGACPICRQPIERVCKYFGK